MDEQYVSIGKAAKMLGMSIEGLRKWEREGRLIPIRTVTNHRRYRVEDLRALMHEDILPSAQDTRCILYARVATKEHQEAGHLERQLGRLMTYVAEQQHWTVVASLTDVGSGLDEQRPGLRQLLDLSRQHHAGIVVVEGRDRLARFGVGYLEVLLQAFGVRIVVMESRMTDDRQELVDDLIAIATLFSERTDDKLWGQKLGVTVGQALRTFTQEGTSD